MANVEKVGGPFEVWRLTDGSAVVELAAGRGALVSRYEIQSTPVLFLDRATFDDPARNVRGGIPVLFPFAGKPPPGSPLPQHGFARTLPWTVTEAIADEAMARVECVLTDSPQTRAAWPYPFRLTQAVSLADARLTLEWALENRGDTPMPLHFGIHPYFAVTQKQAVRVDGAEGVAFDNTSGLERPVARVDFASGEVDLHFANHVGGTTLHRGDGSQVHLAWTPQFDTMVVWTLPDRPFVCVEPWTARGGQPARAMVAPGAIERLAVDLSWFLEAPGSAAPHSTLS